MWAIIDNRSDKVIGLYAMIMLTRSGLNALLTGTFRPNAPSASHCATPADETAAIYKWAVLARGIASGVFAHMAQILASEKYRKIDFYGNGATADGIRIMKVLGYHHLEGYAFPNLYMYQRLPNREVHVKSPNSKKEYNNA
jgi:hypothetical protein